MITTRLLPRRAALADWLRQFDPWLLGALAVVLVATLAGLWQARPVAPPVATVQPIILIATARPAATADTIAVAVAEMRLPRAVVAYDAPGGQVIGAVDSGRAYEIIARSGVEWLRLDVDGSGPVWVLRAELEGEVPDVATPAPPLPTAAPIVVYVAPATPDLPPPTPESPFGSKPNRRAGPPRR